MPRLATVDELKAYLGSGVTGDPGSMFANVLEGTEAFAERYTGRRFSPDPALVQGPVGGDPTDTGSPVTKTFKVEAGQRTVRIPDLRVLLSATLAGAALLDGYDFSLGTYSDESPATHLFIGQPLTYDPLKMESDLVITGRWGFLSTPPDVKDAVLAMAARRYRERDASYADTVSAPDGGILAYFRGVPERVKAVLDTYRLPRLAIATA